jgi:hypothetical protein
MLPGMPGFGGGGPVDPGYSPPWARPQPPVIWPGPNPPYPDIGFPIPQPPIPRPPGGGLPPVFQPVPPGFTPPSDSPAGLPDLASPGFWCYVSTEGVYKPGFIQTALNTSEGHEPKLPEKGTPGEWVIVTGMLTGVAAVYAWIPTQEEGGEGTHKEPTHRTKKHKE